MLIICENYRNSPMNRLLFALLFLSFAAVAAEPAKVVIPIEDHRFNPFEASVAAGERANPANQIHATAEEFGNYDFTRANVIPSGAKPAPLSGPLQPGKSLFVDKPTESTARGVVISV